MLEQAPSAGRPDGYTRVAIALHWLVAALIAAAFGIAWSLPDKLNSPGDLRLLSYHKWIGLSIFGLVVLRSLWRLTHPAPPLPATTLQWQRQIARLTHALLYLLLFAIPASGFLMSSAAGVQVVYLGVLPLPMPLAKDRALAHQLLEIHETLTTILLIVVGIHILAALKHHFIDHDDVLRRMLRPRAH